ncbi:type I secretion system permease/ATPase [Polynucleobacter sp. JS-Safj-400b-B2]|uniref:type I secretion system permease/ATPase n=1 Tax=Polynucleobacter sp. JS-Safj-400b-B2 TaxID=2576921 RepID=UPI001C0CCE1C|nr:type I secretion system permease/ATPase [Polynucleobacter sp. JS-Safj-400b-B2]MBU3626742.1 type I secretion system permease/ATPase [Polynucleobacter sp. JS-Safj-400b-B2]
MMNDSTQDPLNPSSPGASGTLGNGQGAFSAAEEKHSFGSAKKDDIPEAKKRVRGELADDGRKPIEAVLYECRRTFYLAIGITAMVDLLSITPMLYMLNVMDKAISSRSGVTLISLTVLVIALYLFWSSIEWIRSRLLTRLSLRIDWDLSADIFDASFRRHVGRKNVDVHQLLGDLTNLRQFLTGQGILTIIDAPFALVFIAIGGIFHPFLALFALGASLVMLAATYFTQKVTSPILKVASDAQSEAARVASNSLRHAESTLALGMMGAVRQQWYRQHHKFLLNQVNASEASGLTGGFSGFLSKSLPSLQMGLGAFLAMEGLITSGMVMAASMLISKAVSPIQKLLGGWKDIVGARQSYERLNALLISDSKRQTQMQLPPVMGNLTVSKTAVVPPGHNKAVLFDIDFKVNPGQVVAVVGPSAAGKTCLARLLIGVWKPARGSVRLDGVEISDWDHDEFGPQIGYVPQEIEFFEGTVAENIARLGEIDADKVVQAAKLIGMHEVILAFPKGYDTELGQSGFALSGGQRQRLAICRAIYGMPKFIVMDEPNANLDEIGESALVHAINYLKSQGSAVVITTHRPRLVGAADNLLVLRNGSQVGFGPADEMINAVRNLQVVSKPKEADDSSNVALKTGTNDQAITGAATGSGQEDAS